MRVARPHPGPILEGRLTSGQTPSGFLSPNPGQSPEFGERVSHFWGNTLGWS